MDLPLSTRYRRSFARESRAKRVLENDRNFDVASDLSGEAHTQRTTRHPFFRVGLAGEQVEVFREKRQRNRELVLESGKVPFANEFRPIQDKGESFLPVLLRKRLL